MKKIRVAIFASGTGSNVQKIIAYFKEIEKVDIALVVCNNPNASVLTIAEFYGVATLIIEKEKFFKGNGYADELKELGIQIIVLAGFLWKIPDALLKNFPGKIINIHPALLPKYGGKGMYGMAVHEAVIHAGDSYSGITIHLVDEHYDHGKIIFQKVCEVQPGDTPQLLAERIHKLEHKHFPVVIENFIQTIAGNEAV